MRLSETIRNEALRVAPHAESSGLMQAGSRHVRFRRGSQVFRTAGAKQLFAGMLSVLPHQQRILVPFKVEPRGGDAVGVLHVRIDIHVIRVTSLGGSLNIKTDRGGIAALDLALVVMSETFYLIEIPGKLTTAAVGVNRVATNELLLARVVKVLPTRHPGHRARR